MIESRSLYALLPAYFRRRDAEIGYPLRALFDVLEKEGAAVIDADLDAFQDSLFVETCPENLLAEIGALIGAPRLRPLPPEAGVSARAFLSNLLRYRRAKGTPAALEMLARDVTLYSAKAVEYYARLSATPSLRAPRPDRPTTARLNDPDIAATHGTAFDLSPRTPDMRSIARSRGRYNIPHVGVHLWRLEAIPFTGPGKAVATAAELSGTLPMTAWDNHPGHFALNPSGAPTALFMPQQNADTHAPLAHEVPERLRRLPLKRELDAIAAGTLTEQESSWFGPVNPAFELYLRLDGEADFRRVPAKSIRIGALTAPPYTQPAPFSGSQPTGIEACFDPATARLVVRAADAANTVAAVVQARLACAFGQPGALGGGAYDRNDAQSPFRIDQDGTVVLTVEADAPNTGGRFASLATALNAWSDVANAGKRGILVVTANMIDDGANDLVLKLPAGCDLTIVAAQWRPPEPLQPGDDPALMPQGYIVRRGRRMLVLRRMKVTGIAAAGVDPGRLTLDGFVLDQGVEIGENAARRVDIRHSTVLDGQSVPAVAITGTAGQVSLSLFRSLCGTMTAGPSLTSLVARDTIFTAGTGIDAGDAVLDFDSVTAFAAIKAKAIDASNAIFLQNVEMARTQSGCLRYSFTGGTANRLPRRFRCQPDLAWDALKEKLGIMSPAQETLERERLRLALAPRFVDTGAGEPAYGLLAVDTPREIAFGGEDDTEMGAYRFLGGSARVANLIDLFSDFVPFGMEAGVISADRSHADAFRRNLP